MELIVESVSEFYRKIADELLNSEKVFPRGLETKEIIAPKIIIKNPRNSLAFHEDRKFNIVYALVESLMLVQKNDELKYFTEFNKNMANYSDDGIHLHGAYGNRIAYRIFDIIDKLREDSDSRQAVVTIYNNDFVYSTRDVPCTLNLCFSIRNNRLNLVATMRSNDVIWGTPYDIFMFTMIQQVIANTLGIDVGDYIHIPISLHVYSHHYELLDKMKDSENIEVNNNENIEDFINESRSYIQFMNGERPNENLELMPIVYNEKAYRDKYWSLKNDWEITHNIPEWCKKFTRRWYR